MALSGGQGIPGSRPLTLQEMDSRFIGGMGYITAKTFQQINAAIERDGDISEREDIYALLRQRCSGDGPPNLKLLCSDDAKSILNNSSSMNEQSLSFEAALAVGIFLALGLCAIALEFGYFDPVAPTPPPAPTPTPETPPVPEAPGAHPVFLPFAPNRPIIYN